MGRRVVATGVIVVVMLVALLVGQVAERPDRVDTIRPLPLPAGEPRRFADYGGSSNPADDQCSLPLEQRTGGWICTKE